MEKKAFILFIVLTGLLILPFSARADIATGTITAYWGPGNYAGEFFITSTGFTGQGTGTIDPGYFETFCLEYYEDLPGHEEVYDVVLNPSAVPGGINPSTGSVEGGNPLYPVGGNYGDPVDPKTAWLYQSFLDRSLSGYDYFDYTGRTNSANALQLVIWGIEQELGPNWTPAPGLQSQFYNAVLAADPVNTGNVLAMNLYLPGHLGDSAYGGQDLLVSVAVSQSAVVPAPAACVLAILGLILVPRIKRRFA